MVENHDFFMSSAFDALFRGIPRRNIVIMFDTEKLECCGYLMVKYVMCALYILTVSTQ